MAVEAHFIEFMSPGTFLPEITTLPIHAWDVETAKNLATDIVERHGARPFGFRFITRSRGDDDLDSKVSAKSGMYYLGGRIETIDDVRRRNDPAERILLSNMEANEIERIVINTNSWKFTAWLNDDDTVLDYTMPARKPQP